jgi:hypothetical protein
VSYYTKIYSLVGFGPFFDSISFNILGRHERRKAASLGVANIITALLAEDFTWFLYRWWLPLDNDPQKGLLMQASDWTKKFGLYIYTAYKPIW